MEGQDEPEVTPQELAAFSGVPVSVAAVRAKTSREKLVRMVQTGQVAGVIDDRGRYQIAQREVERLEQQARANELAAAVRIKAQAK
jgi:hypothetical protein